MKTQTLTANYIKTISWVNDIIVDWASAGTQYTMDGKTRQLYVNSYSALDFTGAISSHDGKYAFVYQKLGTKGLLIKNGGLLREINRSYYYASTYEYPAAFATIDDITYLIHCPKEYCRLDFENVETGEIVSDVPDRAPEDFFHSRLEISPNGAYLLNKGWHWHPREAIYAYNIKNCIENPLLLDGCDIYPDIDTEVNTAGFISNDIVIIGSGEESFDEENVVFPPKHIAAWNIKDRTVSTPVKVNEDFGNLFAINDELAWDTFSYPKIINVKTGEIIDKNEAINSGKQQSSIVSRNSLAQIVFNRETKQLAIVGKEVIYILTP
ncbi:hypothetical protein [Mucilaginibacter flavus]|uniref:hypothetical protein n=1 Tax=Mucilaginibacter flavus TaxID=931504 RepID=UPI0025B2C3FB|nr:hypothetical protein [Mucilaginibacter flavus]MDN3583672.1 hypothetical protein [Mucilaginibacter flavus]